MILVLYYCIILVLKSFLLFNIELIFIRFSFKIVVLNTILGGIP